ncbi:AIR carboxylase-domain-containing protein [Lentinula aciculospora]|uniref:Phosphoribosylaminoimidazole carboxylase n=1 Tax=Lentinula aciculospora TaxID=153920 RepID=A0A9W9DMK3_9AGAR|nr:AIR carboxylase-domain-containing protein [Lentinula aciculospora]
MSSKVVGILGGGQLGRMLAASASLLNIQVIVLDVGVDAPAKQIIASSSHIDGSFRDKDKIVELASKVDVLTVEIEHVDVEALEAVQRSHPNVAIHPSPSTIRLIQDKFHQKEHLSSVGCPLGPFQAVDGTPEAIAHAAKELGLPLMLKSRTMAYDGRGNYVLRSTDSQSVAAAIHFLGSGSRDLYAEKWVPFVKELAVMVVRGIDGTVSSYPAVETVHRASICHLVWAPFRLSSIDQDPALPTKAERVAREAVEKAFQGAGVFGVEMFLLNDGEILVNEIAPRPHNSGHYTIEACESSQYDNHLRSILGLPLGSTRIKVGAAGMLNVLGSSNDTSKSFASSSSLFFSDDSLVDKLTHIALSTPGASPHLYGKAQSRKGRKMGHITIVGTSDAEVRERMTPLLTCIAEFEGDSQSAQPSSFNPSHLLGYSHPHPLITIIMGSDSDLPTLLPATQILTKYFPSIPFEVTLVSAHRTPIRLVNFAKSAAARGIQVIIAGAGGAAHLPGMVASLTGLPVVGVPVDSKSVSGGGGGGLGGVDAMWSILQMPRGIPVATVAINNSTNAALLAVRIISAGQPHLATQMEDYLQRLGEEVETKVDVMGKVGWAKYGK